MIILSNHYLPRLPYHCIGIKNISLISFSFGQVGVRAYIRNHCPSLTFGEIRLEEGLCPDKE